MSILKILTSTIIVFLSIKTFGESSSRWILSCDQARIEDICWNNGVTTQCRRQVIIFGELARNFFYSQRMLHPNFRNEMILPELQMIPNSPDYKDESQAYGQGRVLYVKQNLVGKNTLTIESFNTSQSTGGMYAQGDFINRYNFYHCL